MLKTFLIACSRAVSLIVISFVLVPASYAIGQKRDRPDSPNNEHSFKRALISPHVDTNTNTEGAVTTSASKIDAEFFQALQIFQSNQIKCAMPSSRKDFEPFREIFIGGKTSAELQTWLATTDQELPVDFDGNTILHHLASSPNASPEFLRVFIESRFAEQMVKPNNAGETALHNFARNQHWGTNFFHADKNRKIFWRKKLPARVMTALGFDGPHRAQLLRPNADGDTPLHIAAATNNPMNLAFLLDMPLEEHVFAPNHKGLNPLYCALQSIEDKKPQQSSFGVVQIIEMLLESPYKNNLIYFGAPPHSNNDSPLKLTPISWALHNNYDKVARTLLPLCDKFPELAKNEQETTNLHQAMQLLDAQKVKELLNNPLTRLQVFQKNSFGEIPLAMARNSSSNDPNVNLISSMINQIQKLAQGQEKEFFKVSKLPPLEKLEGGSGPRIGFDSFYKTMLEGKQLPELKHWLTTTKTTKWPVDGNNNTILHRLASVASIPLAEYFRAFLNSRFAKQLATKNDNGDTALHIFVRHGDREFFNSGYCNIKDIIELNRNVMSHMGFSGSHRAAFLSPNVNGNTPIHIAAIGGHAKTLSDLLEMPLNASAFAPNLNGLNPLYLIFKWVQLEVTQKRIPMIDIGRRASAAVKALLATDYKDDLITHSSSQQNPLAWAVSNGFQYAGYFIVSLSGKYPELVGGKNKIELLHATENLLDAKTVEELTNTPQYLAITTALSEAQKKSVLEDLLFDSMDAVAIPSATLEAKDFEEILSHLRNVEQSPPTNAEQSISGISPRPSEPVKPLSALHCLIDRKYLNIESRLGLSAANRADAAFPKSEVYSLVKPDLKTAESSTVTLSLANGKLALLSLNPIEINKQDRITFVRLGRNERALVPAEDQDGRIILVMPASQKNLAISLLTPHRDVLLINQLDNIDDTADLGLAGARWLASFMAAYELELNDFMIMDDNIESIHTAETTMNAWSDVYALYRQAANLSGSAVLSSTSFNPVGTKTYLTESNILLKSSYGYKVFYVDNKLLKNAIQDYAHLVPHDPRWPLQDIFFQEVARQAGLKINKISGKSLLLKRSRCQKNSCAKSYQARKMSAIVWQNTAPPEDTPAFYRRAYGSLHTIVERSIQRHARNMDKAAHVDLAELSQALFPKSMSPLETETTTTMTSTADGTAQNETRRTKSTKLKKLVHVQKANFNVKTIMLDTLKDITSQSEIYDRLRQPQKDTLVALEEFLQTKASYQTHADVATGVGKTIIFTLLASKFRDKMQAASQNNNKRHILIVTPSLEIDRQIFKSQHFSSNVILVDSANITQETLSRNIGFNSKDSKPQIVVMCQRSLKRWLQENKDAHFLNKFALIIFDELHRTPRDLLNVAKDYSNRSDTLMLGFSATPKKRVRYFGATPFFRYTSQQAVDEGFLSVWEVKFIDQEKVRDVQATKSTIDKILQDAFAGTTNRRGIIWVDTIDQANALALHITNSAYGIKAAPYHSKLVHRRAATESLANGSTDILVAVDTLKEGYDCPSVNLVVIAKKQIGIDDFIQMRGRGIRKVDPTKDTNALIFVVKDSITRESDYYNEIFYREPAAAKAASSASHASKLRTSAWRVIPFPIGTTRLKAMEYGARFLKEDQTKPIFSTISREIYASSNAKVIREQMRWPRNYRATTTSALVRLYHHHFVMRKHEASPTPMPTVLFYEERIDSETGRPTYNLLDAIEGSPDNHDVVHLVQKKRTVQNNLVDVQEEIDHYDMIVKVEDCH